MRKFKEFVRPGSFAALLAVYLLFVILEAFGIGESSPGRIAEIQDLLKWVGAGYISSRGIEKVAAIIKE